jgi:hypothetical protein
MKQNPRRSGTEIKLYTGWAYNFIKWNPKFNFFSGHCFDIHRLKACTRSNLAPYFLLLAKHLLDENGKLKFKPKNIWNLDETNCQLQKRAGKGVDHADAERSIQKEPVRMVNTTVTFCVNAVGECLPPQLIHKSVNIPAEYEYYNARKKDKFWFKLVGMVGKQKKL